MNRNALIVVMAMLFTMTLGASPIMDIDTENKTVTPPKKCAANETEELIEAQMNNCLDSVSLTYPEETLKQTLKRLKIDKGLSPTENINLISCGAQNLMNMTKEKVDELAQSMTNDTISTNQEVVNCVELVQHALNTEEGDDPTIRRIGMCTIGSQRIGKIAQCIFNH